MFKPGIVLRAPRVPHVVVAVKSRVKWIVAGTEGVSKLGSIYALGVYGDGDEVMQTLISKRDEQRKTLEKWEFRLLKSALVDT